MHVLDLQLGWFDWSQVCLWGHSLDGDSETLVLLRDMCDHLFQHRNLVVDGSGLLLEVLWLGFW